MSKKLTNRNSANPSFRPLVDKSRNKLPFVITISHSLDNNFAFKDIKPGNIKDFHNFIEQTAGKGLTISEVDKLFLRKKGKVVETKAVNGVKRDIVHYGKD